ncbi:hypothetical protein ABZ468_52020 [Streptomyces sp. NPDC005708]|uniref:hypothetical protein n=1 Tax=unclassified Streptomyces TaxID=2593676 RepID=UPI0033E2364C
MGSTTRAGQLGVPARRAGGTGAAGESEELARLRRENAQLKKDNKELAMERDVLKRCMVLGVK